MIYFNVGHRNRTFRCPRGVQCYQHWAPYLVGCPCSIPHPASYRQDAVWCPCSSRTASHALVLRPLAAVQRDIVRSIADVAPEPRQVRRVVVRVAFGPAGLDAAPTPGARALAGAAAAGAGLAHAAPLSRAAMASKMGSACHGTTALPRALRSAALPGKDSTVLGGSWGHWN